jgi:hypothetical protein
MKSTTCPTAKPGSRSSRSVRFPSTPPSSSPSTIAQARERTRVAVTTMTTATAASAIVKIHVTLRRARTRRRSCGEIQLEDVAPDRDQVSGGRKVSARYFVNWSTASTAPRGSR